MKCLGQGHTWMQLIFNHQPSGFGALNQQLIVPSELQSPDMFPDKTRFINFCRNKTFYSKDFGTKSKIWAKFKFSVVVSMYLLISMLVVVLHKPSKCC